jgi:hypothetical protein
VTIKWIQELDVVLFGSPSHVTMMLTVDSRTESRGRDINKGTSIKVIDARKSLTDIIKAARTERLDWSVQYCFKFRVSAF